MQRKNCPFERCLVDSFGPGFEWLDDILGNEPEEDEDEQEAPDEELPDDADAE